MEPAKFESGINLTPLKGDTTSNSTPLVGTQKRSLTVSLQQVFIALSVLLILVVVFTSLVPTGVFWLVSLENLSTTSKESTAVNMRLYRDSVLTTAATSLTNFFADHARQGRIMANYFAAYPSIDLFDPSSTAIALRSVLHPLLMSLPVLPLLRKFAFAWQTRDGCQHMYHFTFIATYTPTLRDYSTYDNCISGNMTYYLFNNNSETTNTIGSHLWFPNYTIRGWWARAHDPALVKDGVVWTPMISAAAGDGKMLYVDTLNPNVVNISDPVSYVAWTAVQTLVMRQYMAALNLTAHGFAFLTQSDTDLTLAAASRSDIIPEGLKDFYATNCSDELTRDAALSWLALGKPESYNLLGHAHYIADTQVVPIMGGGITFRLFLVTDERDFLGDIQDANDSANQDALITVVCVLVGEVVVMVLMLVVSVVLSIWLTRPLMKVCRQISCVANLDWDNVRKHPSKQTLYTSTITVPSKDGGVIVVKSLSATLGSNAAEPTPRTPHQVIVRRGSSKTSITEIRHLQEEANRMGDALVSFGKFVPAGVVRHLIKEKLVAEVGMTKTTAAVLFLDIVDFTHIMETQGVQKMMDILGGMFDKFNHVIMDNKGIVDKFIGDAIMAVWNVPDPIDNPVCDAMKAVDQMLQELEVLNDTVFEPTMDGLRMKVRIGLTFGEVYAGNVGSHDRLNYTVIGNTVNLSARLEQLSKDYATTVLVSDEIRGGRCMTPRTSSPQVKAANVNEPIFRCLGFTPVRGFAKLVRIHEFVGYRFQMSPGKLAMLENYQDMDKALMASGSMTSKTPIELISMMKEYVRANSEDKPAFHAFKVMVQADGTPMSGWGNAATSSTELLPKVATNNGNSGDILVNT